MASAACTSACSITNRPPGAKSLAAARATGQITKPREVIPVPDLPKTRSGKITRRLLAQLYEGRPLGDRSSLQNEGSLEAIEQIFSARG